CHVREFDAQPADVARRQEAWQAGLDHNWVPYQHVCHGLTDGVGRPHGSHEAQGAVEGGHVEAQCGPAVDHLDGSGEESYEVLGGHGTGADGSLAVAARAHLARRALTSIDEAPVQVADGYAQTPLPEVVASGVGRLVTGDVQDAKVDGCDGGVGRPIRKALHLEDDRQAGTGACLAGCGYRYVEDALPGIDV